MQQVQGTEHIARRAAPSGRSARRRTLEGHQGQPRNGFQAQPLLVAQALPESGQQDIALRDVDPERRVAGPPAVLHAVKDWHSGSGPPLRSESGVLWVRTGRAAWVGGGTEHTWGRGKPQWQPFPLVHLAARVWWLCSPPTWRLSADAQWVVPNSDANSKRLYGKSGPQLALVLTATTSHHQAATTSTQA